MAFAPIALFVYNRPIHTQKTVEHLLANEEAKDTELFIFSDAAKNEQHEKHVATVRDYIHTIQGFKKVTIIERAQNFGLAKSIISGVTDIIHQFGKIIVFEDDLICSPYTLRYFNDALDFYQSHEKVMHISAYNYPINYTAVYDTFLFRAPSSWGWATWKNCWNKFEENIDTLIAQFDEEKIKEFSIDYSMNFWEQVHELKNGKNNSWAIRWYASIFLNKGLSVIPKFSLIQNIGADGSGVHSGLNDIYHVEVYMQPLIKENFYPGSKEDAEGYKALQYFFKHRKGNIFKRIKRFIQERL